MSRPLASCWPPHPQKIFCARRLAEKVRGGGRADLLAITSAYPKSLFAEAVYCTEACFYPRVASCFPRVASVFPRGLFRAFISLSL